MNFSAPKVLHKILGFSNGNGMHDWKRKRVGLRVSDARYGQEGFGANDENHMDKRLANEMDNVSMQGFVYDYLNGGS